MTEGLNLEKKVRAEDITWPLYVAGVNDRDNLDGISRDNPIISSRYDLTGEKLKLRRQMWEIQKLRKS